MNDMSKRPSLDDLRREVARICSTDGLKDFRDFKPAPADPRLRESGPAKAPGDRGPFGLWLLARAGDDGLIGNLAKLAGDPKFPRDGEPEDVRTRLRECMADGDMFEAVDDAELDWTAY